MPSSTWGACRNEADDTENILIGGCGRRYLGYCRWHNFATAIPVLARFASGANNHRRLAVPVLYADVHDRRPQHGRGDRDQPCWKCCALWGHRCTRSTRLFAPADWRRFDRWSWASSYLSYAWGSRLHLRRGEPH